MRALVTTLLAAVLLAPASARPGAPATRLVVIYRPDSATAVAASERALGLVRIARISQLHVDVLSGSEAALEPLRRLPSIRSAQLDGRVHALRVPNDPFGRASGRRSRRTPCRRGTGRSAARPPSSRSSTPASTPRPSTCAVASCRGPTSWKETTRADDDNGHGTAVAGVVAVAGNNGVGVAGYCWRCTVTPVKVLRSDGSGFFSDVARGIVWATDHGARIVNASLGGPREDVAVAAATQYAAAHGVLVVAAAGNDNNATPAYPAALPSVLSVAASTRADRLYAFSNHGAALAAPGENSTTARGGGYEQFVGTSWLRLS